MKIAYKNGSIRSIASLFLLAAVAVSAPAGAGVIFSENFEAVTVDQTTVAAATPALLKPNTRAFNTDATEASFNVRLSTNQINNGGPVVTFGDNDFDAFFTSKFLVIGDDADQLGGNPNGTNNPTTMTLTFALAAITTNAYQVSFNYVFDANFDPTTQTNSDDFLAELVFADNSTANLLNFVDPSATTRGLFNSTVNSGGKVATGLRFTLIEFNGNGSSAVGIDNIVVAVPEPETVLLIGLGLAGIGWSRRRK